MAISKALSARREKTLNKMVNYGKYGIMKRREFIKTRITAGDKVIKVSVPHVAREEKIQEELNTIRKGWYIPGLSNPNHPTAKHYAALTQQLEEGVYKDEYRLLITNNPGVFYNITKTEYDYGITL